MADDDANIVSRQGVYIADTGDSALSRIPRKIKIALPDFGKPARRVIDFKRVAVLPN